MPLIELWSAGNVSTGRRLVRFKTRLNRKTAVHRLQGVIDAGLTSAFAIGMATGISQKEIELFLVRRIEPTADQETALEKLLKNHKLAIKLVNAETMKGRL
jgi:hypothetical protein